MSIRFLTHIKNRVRVVRLDQIGDTREYHHSWRHDEGWSSEYARFALTERPDGLYVESQFGTDGRDCDGRMSTWTECECHVNNLKAGYEHKWPLWATITNGQRDHQAEAAGY